MLNFKDYILKRKSFKYLLIFFIFYLIIQILIYNKIVSLLPETLQLILALTALVWWILVFYYILLIILWLKRKLFWKIRNRLIVSQFFISVVPIILILILIAFGLILITYQVASYQINNYLNLKSKEIHEKNIDYYKDNIRCDNVISSEQIIKFLSEQGKGNKIEGINPIIVIIDKKITFIYKGNYKEITDVFPYEKLSADADIIYSKYLTTLIKKYFNKLEENERIPDVYFVSAIRCRDKIIYTFLPLLNNYLKAAIPILGYALSEDYYGGNAIVSNEEARISFSLDKKNHNEIASKNNNFPILILLRQFELSEIMLKKFHAIVIMIDIRKTISNIFYSKSYASLAGQKILGALYVVAIIFVIVEIISLIIGIKMTRAITKAVDSLYKGTNKIQSGDLDTTIEIKSEDQLSDLAKSFNSMAVSIKELLIEKAKKEAMQKELEIARDVQKYLYPLGDITFPNLEIVSKYVAARMVSGDYYDFFPYEKQLLFVIGDVSGKGISAGLIMANTQAILRSHYLQTLNNGKVPDLNYLINNINNHLYNYSSPNKYITMNFSIYDSITKNLTYCNAGHCPPILFRANDQVNKLDPTSTVLGAFDNIPFTAKTIQLYPNDIILFYTDGLIEAFNEADEEYGEDRVINHIIKNKELDLTNVINDLIQDIYSFTNNNLSDDIAIIAIKCK